MYIIQFYQSLTSIEQAMKKKHWQLHIELHKGVHKFGISLSVRCNIS